MILGLKRLAKQLPPRRDGVPHHLAAAFAWRAWRAHSLRPASAPRTGPLVVGALGGSATRLIVALLRRGGVWMGDWVDHRTEDALAFRVFLRRHFGPLASECMASSGEPLVVSSAVQADFDRSLAVHRLGHPHEASSWGWKNPRMMWLLPFLAPRLPGLRFIHVLRDGREMALSENDFLLQREGRQLLPGDLPADPRRCQLLLWARGNRAAARSAAQYLAPEDTLTIRYEDLCQAPLSEVTRLFEFAGIREPERRAEEAASMIRPSPRLGRWRELGDPALRDLDLETREALGALGYA